MQTARVPVASEGYPFILISGFATLIFALLNYPCLAVNGLLLTLFTLWFFRDPERIAPEDEQAIVAPADGKVILIKKIEDDRFLKGPVRKVSIFMNVFNVHVNRIPFPGTVVRIAMQPGKFYAADKQVAELNNEYCAMTLRTQDDRYYGIVQVAGLVARRIICWADKGDQLTTGQRYGLIRFGSRVDLYLPLDVELNIKVDDKVRAGETILGHYPVQDVTPA